MHHRPSGPPLSARILRALAPLRRGFFLRLGRLAFGALVTTTVVALVLAIPVISGAGAGSPEVQLDSSSTSAAPRESGSPVVMGVDGQPVKSSAFAGVQTSAAASPGTPATVQAAPDPATPPTATGDEPAAPGTTGTTGSAPAGTPPTGADAPAPAPSAAGSPSTSASSPPTSAGVPGTTAPGTSVPVVVEPAEVPAVPAASAVSEVVALVNAERAAAGCDAAVPDPGLTAAAGAHSAAMSTRGVLGVDGLDLPGLGEATATVAQGRPNAQAAVAGWLADDADRAALLDCSRTSIGVGAVDGWWTTLVA